MIRLHSPDARHELGVWLAQHRDAVNDLLDIVETETEHRGAQANPADAFDGLAKRIIGNLNRNARSDVFAWLEWLTRDE